MIGQRGGRVADCGGGGDKELAFSHETKEIRINNRGTFSESDMAIGRAWIAPSPPPPPVLRTILMRRDPNQLLAIARLPGTPTTYSG